MLLLLRKSRLLASIVVLLTSMVLAAVFFFVNGPPHPARDRHSPNDFDKGRWPARINPFAPKPSSAERSNQHDWNKPDTPQSYRPSNLTDEDEYTGVPVGIFPNPEIRNRHEAVEVWRNKDEVIPVDRYMVSQRGSRERPFAKPRHRFERQGEWLEQQIVADYPDHPLVNETFVMIKTGSETQWRRMPWHIWTTFTKLKHFALYSDQPGSIAGYEIIDILTDIPADIMKEKDDFRRYKLAHQMTEEHWCWDAETLDAKGGWGLDKFKNLPMLHHAYKTMPNAKWYFFIDDDTFILWDNLYHLLDQYNSTEPFYLGSPVSLENEHPFAHGGSGVVLSQGAMAVLFDHSDQQNRMMLDEYARQVSGQCCGDSIVADALADRGVRLDKLGFNNYTEFGGPFQGGSIWGYKFVPGSFYQRPISFHHINCRQAELLYQYERLRRGTSPISVAEIYRDFILPHITTERKHWRMAQSDEKFKPQEEKPSNAPLKDGDQPLYPWKSKDLCKRACELTKNCWQWSYVGNFCELSYSGFSLGRAVNHVKTGLESEERSNTVFTGWMIERIRQMRALDPTDPLKFDNITQTWNDDDNTSEGWYLRQLNSNFYTPYDKDLASF